MVDPKDRLKLFQGQSWATTSQPVWKECLWVYEGIVLGAAGHAEMSHVLGLIPQEGSIRGQCITTSSLCEPGHFSSSLCLGFLM